MADVRPFPGLRYADTASLAALVTPPYDVISPEAQARYYERDPRNIIRLELGHDEPGDDELNNKYTRAAATFADWRLGGILAQDAPALYLYEQRFAANGREHTRASLMARARLEPWEAGVILPHERTLSKPKEDRLRLLRATAANLSPIMALYDDPRGELAALIAAAREAPPAADFTDESGEGHRLWLITGDAPAGRAAAFFRDRQLYIADGHHRYETALAYREERRAQLKGVMDADDAANFTFMALSAVEDPGLVVLPTHRVLGDLDPARVAALGQATAEYFDVEPLDTATAAAASAALANASAEGRPAFIVAGPDSLRLFRLADGGRAAMARLSGEDVGTSAAWRTLDLAVLHELLLRRGLGVTPEMVRAGQHVTYTRSAEAALDAARARPDGATLAVLVNPTPPVAIRDVARAGDRMPQKSTYFYPKLITGLVINPVW